MPKVNIKFHSLYEKLFSKPPNLEKVRVFWCLCYLWLKPYSSNKIETKSKPCVFLGYSLSQSLYHCLDPITYIIFVFHHVPFVESIFPFNNLSYEPNSSSHAVSAFSPQVSNTTLSVRIISYTLSIFPMDNNAIMGTESQRKSL